MTKSDLVIQGIISTNHSGDIINRLEYPEINIDLHLGGGKIKIDKYQLFQNRGPYAKLYNRRIIHDNGLHFEEDISIAEDGIFFYSYLLYVHRLVVTSYAGYYYIKYGGNTHVDTPLTTKQRQPIAAAAVAA